ncbi:MAG: hypothetical protein M3480_06835 [Verrucomicrobiota bacterium]|nr:hypothetical protein [Chthoniobacterales bacterium]MDQ3414673.1 hypothetical protein [Verrucomicrobiota bacterium]
MKNTPQIQDCIPQHESNPRTERYGSSFPQISHRYQSAQLTGRCGTPAQYRHPAFFEISQKYFAEEASRGFVLDTGVFAALILTALFPIANSLQAVAILVHSISVL